MLGGFKSSHWYLGLTDEGSEGVWRWVHTNATTKYTAWSKGQRQPEGGTSQNCVVYSYADSFHWHDIGCAAECSTICKKRVQ
ncbi:C-type lectin domain family 4 member D-like [Mercenaria mercenaria]|uniref:C-type lectin domain family 4 member D-like n=1 Tax=Mercenaria mercenaria TaxID=6596 RepID=UPI00234FB361|nr:C-type lectin domain family 4 member D-like [Mercenaria mercenaria]